MEEKNICLEEKRVFYRNIRNLIFFISMILLIYFIQQDSNNKVLKIVEHFNSNQEIICDKKIVSIQKGYNFYEKDNSYITNGENMFLINRCSIKE